MRNETTTDEPERLETYLELERYLEHLQHEQRPQRPLQMTPSQMRIYQMAALFHAAAPGATMPDACFVKTLWATIEDHLSRRRGFARSFVSILLFRR